MTARTELSRMDLRAAKLCMELDCNTIFDTALYRHCPTCGSVESYPLESWLNRERVPTASAAARASVAFPPRALWSSRPGGKRTVAEPLRPRAGLLRRRVG